MDLQYLPLTVDEVPVEKDFLIGETYSFRFLYNDRTDFYTCTILDLDGNILFITKILYATPMIDSVVDGLNVNRKILPLNPQEIEQASILQGQVVNRASLGSTILLLLGNIISS